MSETRCRDRDTSKETGRRTYVMTPEQVADRLQVSRSLIWRRVVNGQIPSTRVERARLIKAETVAKLLETSRRNNR